MPNVYLAPAELRAILRELTQLSTRNATVNTAIDKLYEALDAARQRRENRQLEAHTRTRLRNEAIEAHNRELYEGWHDLNDEQPGYENGKPVWYTAKLDSAGNLTTTSRPRDTDEPTHCRNGHNKHLTRCQCDDTQ